MLETVIKRDRGMGTPARVSEKTVTLTIDGQEITVPEGPSAGEESDLLDLNTATEAQLRTLPGIGEVLARRIVDYREMNGPFASVEELTAVEGIGNALLYRLRELVTVK